LCIKAEPLQFQRQGIPVNLLEESVPQGVIDPVESLQDTVGELLRKTSSPPEPGFETEATIVSVKTSPSLG
jgi:hypothetical protein